MRLEPDLLSSTKILVGMLWRAGNGARATDMRRAMEEVEKAIAHEERIRKTEADLYTAAKALWDAMPAPRSEKVTVPWLAMRDAIAKAEGRV